MRSLIEIGQCICERRLCHGAPWQRLNSVQPKFIFIDQSFSLPANMAALRAPVASLSSKQKTPSASVCRMIAGQSQGCGEQAGGLWLLSHSSVQCTLLGPNFLLRSFNTTYSLCKSGHKCFYTIQPGLQNLSPSSQWWEQEMIGWCPHILYPNGHQF